MTATYEGLTARLDAIAIIRDEAATPTGRRPLWCAAYQSLDEDELQLLFLATVITAAELIRRNPRGPAPATALLFALADGIEATRLTLQPNAQTRPTQHRRRPRWRTACSVLGAWLIKQGQA